MIQRLRQINKTRAPEDSVGLRAAVLGAVVTGTIALAVEGAISPWSLMLLLVTLPFAYWVSHVRRAEDNWHIKLALALGALVALARFFGQLGGISTLDEVRFPLADLFLWVQVLHGFDLPARKDLHFSLGSSLTLMAVAGSISQDLRFGGLAVLYFVVVIVALVLAHRSETHADTAASMMPKTPSAPGRSTRRPALRWQDFAVAGIAAALAGSLLFLVIPQPTNARTFALPFSLGGGVGSPAVGALVNPGFSGDPSARSSGVSYHGFSERMDMRVRGELSDQLVMRVRATAPAMWRAALFDNYDGTTWTGDPSDPTPLGGEPPYGYPPALRSLGPRSTVTQTFYIETEQPSAIFAAGQPDSVFYDGGVSIDALGALRTSSTLTEGTVYSVVSTRGAATPAQLRSLPEEQPDESLSRYLQVPANLPARVEALARRITASATTDYDRVRMIEAYLRANYRYTIDSPVPPEGRDAVDHFLFDSKVGFCEQFAAATTIMLRTLGIPSRIAAGYAVGRRNPFTGYYEVKGSDAHTWVEVLFPRNYGWYEFDPTFAVPPAEAGLSETLPLAKVISFAADKIGALVPGGMGGALRLLLWSAVAIVLGWGVIVARSRLAGRGRARGAPGRAGEDLGPVGRAFERWEGALTAAGSGRAPRETARELMSRARRPDASRDRARATLDAFEQERYGDEPPASGAAAAAVEELDRLASTVRRAASPTSGP